MRHAAALSRLIWRGVGDGVRSRYSGERWGSALSSLTYQYDVVGARAAGVHPVLMDPFDLRPEADCDRIKSLGEAVALIS